MTTIHRVTIVLVVLMSIAALFSGSVVRAEQADADSLVMPELIASSVVKPGYPEAERKAGVEGTVILEVEVTKDGAVGVAKIDRAVQEHPAFSDSALAAVHAWRFKPGRRGGEAVACTVKIPVRYALDGGKDAEKAK